MRCIGQINRRVTVSFCVDSKAAEEFAEHLEGERLSTSVSEIMFCGGHTN